MSTDKHHLFLTYVRDYVATNPDVAAYVSDAVARGLNEAFTEARDRAVDMEVALDVSIHTKVWKDGDNIILSKLRKWVGKSAVPWESTIVEIESRIDAKEAERKRCQKGGNVLGHATPPIEE